jgi:hypothetical protein
MVSKNWEIIGILPFTQSLDSGSICWWKEIKAGVLRRVQFSASLGISVLWVTSNRAAT